MGKNEFELMYGGHAFSCQSYIWNTTVLHNSNLNILRDVGIGLKRMFQYYSIEACFSNIFLYILPSERHFLLKRKSGGMPPPVCRLAYFIPLYSNVVHPIVAFVLFQLLFFLISGLENHKVQCDLFIQYAKCCCIAGTLDYLSFHIFPTEQPGTTSLPTIHQLFFIMMGRLQRDLILCLLLKSCVKQYQTLQASMLQ